MFEIFETIGTLLTIFFWAAAIFLFGVGILLCIFNLKDGTGGEKALAAIAIILGVIAFVFVYDWCESIVWCMIASGLVLCGVGNALSDQTPAPKQNSGPSVGRVILDEAIQYQRDKEVVKNALREYENEH